MPALEGLHHVTAITADAPRNVVFYARLLGLRLVKQMVDFDRPDVYHLHYGDERGSPGSIPTFFEFPAAARGRHGEGMRYSIAWRVADESALASRDIGFERDEPAESLGEELKLPAQYEARREELDAV